MDDLISTGKKFIILSKAVTDATIGTISGFAADCDFVFELDFDETYSPCEVDFFATGGQGVIYFMTEIKKVEGRKLTVALPEEIIVLQRREFVRTPMEQKILIRGENGENVRALITDISAGGMKAETNKPLTVKKVYPINISVDEKIRLKCDFTPMTVAYDEQNDKYFVAGQFSRLDGMTKINLSQYCYMKNTKIENLNRLFDLIKKIGGEHG